MALCLVTYLVRLSRHENEILSLVMRRLHLQACSDRPAPVTAGWLQRLLPLDVSLTAFVVAVGQGFLRTGEAIIHYEKTKKGNDMSERAPCFSWV